MRRVLPGEATTLTGNLVTFSDSLPVTAGTIEAPLMLVFPGDAADGYFWDTNSGAWAVETLFDTTGTHPTATYAGISGIWKVAITTAMTTGKDGGVILLSDLTDDSTGAATTTTAGALDAVMVGSFHEHRA